MIHAWASATSATGADSGWSSISTTATAMNGTTCATVVRVQSLPRRRRVASLARGRQGTAASSGRGPAACWKPAASTVVLAAGDGPAEDDRVGIERELADLRGVPRTVAHHPDVALVQLTPEGLHGGVVRRLVLGGPLGEGGVACVVHADQSRHRADLLESGCAPMIRREPGG